MGSDQGMSPYSVLKVNIYLNNFSTTFATRAPRRNSCDPCGGHREPLLYASACAYMYMQAPCTFHISECQVSTRPIIKLMGVKKKGMSCVIFYFGFDRLCPFSPPVFRFYVDAAITPVALSSASSGFIQPPAITKLSSPLDEPFIPASQSESHVSNHGPGRNHKTSHLSFGFCDIFCGL